ncbi:hypothetical protein Nepgr_027057 [Nepenthes gracilis]|uniref:Protein kinase domain-containing protein n=1 Tax=Nepenthes gracilis TaxID=150966 RepID=A0AAD3Y2Q9_NEPGR|nr:hypothetical protein Nepgr_027057 [Nepenthes gracilis]
MRSKAVDLRPWRRILSLAVFLYIILGPSSGLTIDGVLLLSFKKSILSDPLSVLASWNCYDDTPCSWQGVTCGGWARRMSAVSVDATASRVTGVSLPDSQLLGSIPADLGMIQNLHTLNLSNNSINGSLPSSLFNATELRVLDLSGNWLSGELPEPVEGLRRLEVLNLSDNAFAGIIPENLTNLSNLSVISLRNNYFSGGIPGGFYRSQILDLSSNLINGTLPSDFGGQNLQYFNVSYNKLSGEIPPEFAEKIPENATLDFSFNNLTGEIPESSVLIQQVSESFSGNPDLCGKPLRNPCPIPSSPTILPNSSQPTSPPAIAAIPRTPNSPPEANSPSIGGQQQSPPSEKGLKPSTIAEIVVGDIAGIGFLSLVVLYVYRVRRKKTTRKNRIIENKDDSSSSSFSKSESKGIAKWSCLRNGGSGGDGMGSSSEGANSEDEGRETAKSPVASAQLQKDHNPGTLVTVDGERELELETLLKASAYILGATGTSITYKAVLEDGAALAVRRIGDGGLERFKDFDAQVRAIAKLVHPNLVRVRGFYWGPDEKLVIGEYVVNGSLANARHRKAGSSSPCHLPWESRLKIAKGVARGLTFLHEKKHTHGNLKPGNILLDIDMEPKISDFGLERLMTKESGFRAGGSTRFLGSHRSSASRDSFRELTAATTPSPSASLIGSVSPYQPPESLRSLKTNSKWDVYSFGVVLLELITGKAMSPEELVPGVEALKVDDKARVLRMADAAIRADLEGKEDSLLDCLKLGYSCASIPPQKRPAMKEVLQVLEKFPTSSSIYYYGP